MPNRMPKKKKVTPACFFFKNLAFADVETDAEKLSAEKIRIHSIVKINARTRKYSLEKYDSFNHVTFGLTSFINLYFSCTCLVRQP